MRPFPYPQLTTVLPDGNKMRRGCEDLRGERIGRGRREHRADGESVSRSIHTQNADSVAAGALLTEGTVIPPRSLVLGMPAKVKRELTDKEVADIDEYAKRYYEYKEMYLTMRK